MTDLATEIQRSFTAVTSEYLVRYLVATCGVYLTVNLALAARLARLKIRDRTPPGRQILIEVLASLRTVLVFGVIGVVAILGTDLGVFHLYFAVARHGVAYLVISTLVLILLHDAYFYWSHRLLHYPPIFRRAHRLHHKSNNPTPFTALSFNTGEALANAVFVLIVLAVMPLHPIAFLVFGWHQMIRNAIGHSGYELFPARADGRPRFDWLTTVTHHDMHHAYAHWNMGLYFTWWDRWMGTEHPDYHARFKAVAQRQAAAPAAASPAA